MGYNFRTFDNYISYLNYVRTLSNGEMRRIIDDVYIAIKNDKGVKKNIKLDALNAAEFKAILILIDYCFKMSPFDEKNTQMSIFMIEAIKHLFTINPYEIDSFDGRVSAFLEGLVSRAEGKGIVTTDDFMSAVDIIDYKIGLEDFLFCEK